MVFWRQLSNYAEQQKKSGILGFRQFNAETDELIDFGVILDPFMNSIPNRNLSRNHVAMMIGACMWMPKSLWKSAGGFPKWFQTMHEDMYICCMVRLYGYPVQMINSSGYLQIVENRKEKGKVKQRVIATVARRLSDHLQIMLDDLYASIPIREIHSPLPV